MFRRFQRFYTSIKVVVDVVVLAIAFVLAYLTRFRSIWVQPEPLSRQTILSLLSALIIFPIVFYQSRLYATNRIRSHIGEVFEIFKATVFSALILVALTYFTRERYSRLTLGIFLLYS